MVFVFKLIQITPYRKLKRNNGKLFMTIMEIVGLTIIRDGFII